MLNGHGSFAAQRIVQRQRRQSGSGPAAIHPIDQCIEQCVLSGRVRRLGRGRSGFGGGCPAPVGAVVGSVVGTGSVGAVVGAVVGAGSVAGGSVSGGRVTGGSVRSGSLGARGGLGSHRRQCGSLRLRGLGSGAGHGRRRGRGRIRSLRGDVHISDPVAPAQQETTQKYSNDPAFHGYPPLSLILCTSYR